ncbi:MAG: Apolipoprotein N-acyltransferase [Alphaproteobacteria bacterium MarineAlpha5_Bin8]|nr:MAG: Apolipoprotein N-acyltransferase [Alphaproteobacteria bacterium MarineAlpha5_Bin8]PPR46136.1 MAG: Apolipoprotein N-acyltransferase [Alphaproteobacteria bacterium MarineAlpha5_Bin7]
MQTLFKFVVCGLLSSFLFPPFFILPLGFVAFPIFFFLITDQKFLRKTKFFKFLCGLFYGLALNFIALIWIKEPFLIYKETSELFILSYLLVLYCSLYYGFCTLILSFIKNNFSKLMLIPVLFVLCEILRESIGYGFPWITYSLVYSSNIFTINFIYYLGTYGLSFFIILVFLIPTNIILILFNKKNYLLKIYFVTSLLIIVAFSSLVINRINFSKENKNNLYEILLVQLNSSLLDRNKNLSQQNTMEEITKIIQMNKSDLLVFSENDFPYIVESLNQLKFLQDMMHEDQTIIIGATKKDNSKYFNTLFSIQKNNILEFDKIKLVPFGEFLPFRKYLNFFNIIVGQNDYSIGEKNRHILISNNISILPIICYEIIFFNDLINKENFESNLLVNITNDSWFGELSGPYQHFYITRKRAVEFNKTLIRVSNNGISAIIDELGNIISHIPLNEKRTLAKNINKPENLFNLTYFHNLIFIFLFFISLGALIINLKNNE